MQTGIDCQFGQLKYDRLFEARGRCVTIFASSLPPATLWSARSCRVHVAMQEIIRKHTAETVKRTRKPPEEDTANLYGCLLPRAGHSLAVTSWQFRGGHQKPHVTLGVLAGLLLAAKFWLKLYSDIVPPLTFRNPARWVRCDACRLGQAALSCPGSGLCLATKRVIYWTRVVCRIERQCFGRRCRRRETREKSRQKSKR